MNWLKRLFKKKNDRYMRYVVNFDVPSGSVRWQTSKDKVKWRWAKSNYGAVVTNINKPEDALKNYGCVLQSIAFSPFLDHTPPTEKEMDSMSARAEKWWLEQKRREKTRVSTYEFKYKLFLTRKAVLQFAQEHRDNGHNFGFDRGVEAYRQWMEKDTNRLNAKVVNAEYRASVYQDEMLRLYTEDTEFVKRASQPKKAIHFRVNVNVSGGEYQVKIYPGDPVSLCEIHTKKAFITHGYTKRNPKDTWSAKIAVTQSMANALLEAGFDEETRAVFYEKLFKKYPELRNK